MKRYASRDAAWGDQGMEILPEFVGALTCLRDCRHNKRPHPWILLPVSALLIVSEVSGDLRGHALVAHGRPIRFQENMKFIFPFRSVRLLKDEIRIRTDGDWRIIPAVDDGIP